MVLRIKLIFKLRICHYSMFVDKEFSSIVHSTDSGHIPSFDKDLNNSLEERWGFTIIKAPNGQYSI